MTKIERIGRLAFYGLALIVPLWVLPFTIAPIVINKVFLAYALILVALLAWLTSRMRAGSLELPRSSVAFALVLFASAVFISGIFSESRPASFDELSGDPSSVATVGLFVVAAFLAAAYLNTEASAIRWITLLFASFSALGIFQAAKIAFSLNPAPSWADLPFPTSTVFGTWVEFGIFASIAGFAALFLWETAEAKKFRPAYGAIVAMAMAAMVAVNARAIWGVFFAVLAALFAYAFSLRLSDKSIFRPTAILLAVVLFALEMPTLIGGVTGWLGTQSVEVRPSFSATWTVLTGTLAEHPVLGSGPGTFAYAWIRHRPAEVNQGSFWNMRFASGSGFWLSLAAMTGGAGILALAFLAVAFVRQGFRVIASTLREKKHAVAALAMLLALMIGAYAAVYNPGFVLLLYFFIFLGISMGLAGGQGIAKRMTIPLFANSGASFTATLLIIGVLVGTVAYGYRIGGAYAAAYFYGRGVSLVNRAGNAEEAVSILGRASSLNDNDLYWRGLASAKLAMLSGILNSSESPEAVQARFGQVAGEAIEAAQAATRVNAVDPENWKALAGVYETLAPLNISGVVNAALGAYDEAAKRDPANPEPILAKARIFRDSGDLTKARDYAEQALRLKPNYVSAYLFLAELDEKAGDVSGAIERLQKAALLNPTESGTLFELGLLQYRNGQLEDAGRLFRRAVELSPTYSNARYFLGLVYDRLGDPKAALAEFERVLAFNPDSAEVRSIIEDLKAGKSATRE